MTVASKHNGGRSQVNPNFLQTGGAYPFLNALKTAQRWSWVDNTNAPVLPDVLDDDGYPTSIVHGGVYTVFSVPSAAARPSANGNTYVITWDGNGIIRCNMSNTLISGSKTSSTGSGRYVFSTTDTLFNVGITAIGSPRITNLKVYHIDDEPAVFAGEIFGAKFKQRLIEGGFGVIRFLNWGGYASGFNSSNQTNWASRKAASYVYYAGHEVRSALYAGSTSLTGQAYSVSPPPGFTLVDKAMVHILFAQSYSPVSATFTNGSANIGVPAHGLSINSPLTFGGDFSNQTWPAPTNIDRNTTYYVVSVPDADTITVSATKGGSAIVASGTQSTTIYAQPVLTLNVGTSGDKSILSATCDNLSFRNNAYPVANTYQSFATLIYDATLGAWVKYGGDVAAGGFGLDNGAPPELMVQLAAEVGAHPWFTMPFLASDPMTDYVPELVNYVKSAGPSWMVPRFEPPNELWNGAGGFFQTPYAIAKAAVEWNGGTLHDWYGKAASTLGQAVAAIYGTGGLGSAYQIMVGVQTALGNSSGNRANCVERLNSSKYIAQVAAAQSLTWSGGTINFTKSAAKGWISHLTCANYVNPSDYNTASETTKAAAFGGVRFVASIVNGAMTVSAINTSGGGLAVGMTVFGRGIAGGVLQSGVMITGGSAPNWMLSDSTINLSSDTFYAAVDMTQPASYVDTLASGSGQFNLASCATLYANWKAWAAGFGVNRMAAYEGGYSPDYIGSASSDVNLLRYASKLVVSSPLGTFGLLTHITKNYTDFIAAGGEFPSCFQLSGGYPSGNSWAVLEDIYQTPDPPQWEAIRLFNAMKRRMIW